MNEALTWWDSLPKERRRKISGFFYGVTIMVDDEMILKMHNSLKH